MVILFVLRRLPLPTGYTVAPVLDVAILFRPKAIAIIL